jgi:hypothetical protein
MLEKTTWERFFDAHAPICENNVFTKNTLREVDFLLGRPWQVVCLRYMAVVTSPMSEDLAKKEVYDGR